MGIQTTKEVSTRFGKYHVVPMHNSTAKDGKQNHTTGLALPRSDDVANRNVTEDRLLFPVTNGQSTTDNLHDMTLPSANIQND